MNKLLESKEGPIILAGILITALLLMSVPWVWILLVNSVIGATFVFLGWLNGLKDQRDGGICIAGASILLAVALLTGYLD